MTILMILTSHGQLGNTGLKTGFWLEEFAAPYYIFQDSGTKVTLASPHGGQPPLDPKSDELDFQTEATERFKKDPGSQLALAKTLKLSKISPEDYDAVFYVGGHGPLWDLAEDPYSIALIERMYASGKPVAAVCHAPAVLRHPKAPNGSPIIQGKSVTGFSNTEEEAVQLSKIVPFLLEDELIAKGGIYSKKDNWHAHTITDGNLITGQNPASSDPAARAVVEILKQ